ncbi:hypothetical protein [Nonomuraea sp. NPDC049784]|uniref:hypothetical protein n=1 Tax=Nonomuraea sp. NPDC049784 TaxID=3154361 RepID=UPI0033C590D6
MKTKLVPVVAGAAVALALTAVPASAATASKHIDVSCSTTYKGTRYTGTVRVYYTGTMREGRGTVTSMKYRISNKTFRTNNNVEFDHSWDFTRTPTTNRDNGVADGLWHGFRKKDYRYVDTKFLWVKFVFDLSGHDPSCSTSVSP